MRSWGTWERWNVAIFLWFPHKLDARDCQLNVNKRYWQFISYDLSFMLKYYSFTECYQIWWWIWSLFPYPYTFIWENKYSWSQPWLHTTILYQQWGCLQLIFMVEPWGRHVKKAQIMWLLLLLVANFSTNNSFVCCFWNIIQVLKHEHIVLLLLSLLLWIKQVSFSLFLLQLFLTLFELFKIITELFLILPNILRG